MSTTHPPQYPPPSIPTHHHSNPYNPYPTLQFPLIFLNLLLYQTPKNSLNHHHSFKLHPLISTQPSQSSSPISSTHSIHPPIQSFTHPSNHSPTHPIIHPPIQSFTHPSNHSPTHPIIHPPIQSFTHPSNHSPTHPIIHPPIQSFTYPSNHSPTHPIIHPPIQFSTHPPTQHWKDISQAAKSFIDSLLVVDPSKRLTSAEALQHHWLSDPSPATTGHSTRTTTATCCGSHNQAASSASSTSSHPSHHHTHSTKGDSDKSSTRLELFFN